MSPCSLAASALSLLVVLSGRLPLAISIEQESGRSEYCFGFPSLPPHCSLMRPSLASASRVSDREYAPPSFLLLSLPSSPSATNRFASTAWAKFPAISGVECPCAIVSFFTACQGESGRVGVSGRVGGKGGGSIALIIPKKDRLLLNSLLIDFSQNR